MKPFVAVLRREIGEHRLLLAGAVLISLFPLLLPFLPGVAQSAGDTADARAGTALILAGVLSAILAVTLGATVLARDLSERRLGFYFSRPIPGLAIWAGKVLAVLAVILTVTAVVLLPPFLLGDFKDADHLTGLPPLPLAGLWLGLVLLLLLAAHTVSSMVRSRTAWLLLDLAAAVAISGLLLACYRRLSGEGAYRVVQILALVFVAVLVLALLTANLLQILRGRTELHRGHRWLSTALWSLLFAGVVALAGYAEWVLRAEPGDLRKLYQARSAPTGEWVYVAGAAAGRPGYEPAFLLEPSSGRFVRLFATPFWPYQWLEFSADGRWAAWLELGNPAALVLLDLQAPELRPIRHALREVPGGMALSPDGSRIALRTRGRLLVQEAATARLIASAPLRSSELVSLYFRDPGHLVLLRSEVQGDPSAVVEQMEVASGKLSRVSTVPGRVWKGALSPDGRRLLVNNGEGRGFDLFDVVSGERLSRLQPPPKVGFTGDAAFLGDGRIAASRWSYAATELRIFDRDGARALRTFRWPNYRDLQIGGELQGGRLVVTLAKERFRVGGSRRLQTVVLDLGTGKSRPLGMGLVPLWNYTEEPGPVSPTLFLRHRKELVRLDPATGELRKVLDLS